jgi:hypothetical protein
MFDLCAPALIYVAFSLTQIVIDTFKGFYNTAFLKVIVMIIITILLNTLCYTGMGTIAWIIVFIPFIFMSLIIAILLYVFGLDPSNGHIDVNSNKGGNLIYTSMNASNASNATNTINKYIDVSYSESPDPLFE